MELKSGTTYDTIGKNTDGSVKIRFTLSSTPTERWTNTFNSNSDTIKSISGSAYLFLSDYSENIDQEDVVSLVKEMIVNTDTAIASDDAKEKVILSSLKSGSIIAHDGLSYDSSSGISQYQEFLNKINNNQIL